MNDAIKGHSKDTVLMIPRLLLVSNSVVIKNDPKDKSHVHTPFTYHFFSNGETQVNKTLCCWSLALRHRIAGVCMIMIC